MTTVERKLCEKVLPILREAVRHQVTMWEELGKLEKLLDCDVECHHLHAVSVEGMEDFDAIDIEQTKHFLEDLLESPQEEVRP